MRTKFHAAWVTLGLAATTLLKTGQAGAGTPETSRLELGIDAGWYPTQLHFTLPKRPGSFWDRADVTATGPDDSTDLNLALSSPGLLFGLPRDFFIFSIYFGSSATTAVVFPSLPR
jgi:hypothetical protein